MGKKNHNTFLLLSFLILYFQLSAAQSQPPNLRGDSARRRPPSTQPTPTHVPTNHYFSKTRGSGSGSVKASGSGGNVRSRRKIVASLNTCGNVGQLFQLNLQIDHDSCETSWKLERAITDETTYYVYVDGYDSNFVVNDFESLSSSVSRNLCLREGKYRFTIYDAFGDGIAAPGYYILALDGIVLGGSSNFGYEEVTNFNVMSRQPMSSDAEPGGGSSSGDATIADDYYIDDTFSTFVPERLSGIVDLSLVSMTEDINHQKDDFLEDGLNSTTWTEILNDDFASGLGLFHDSAVGTSSHYVTYYPFVKDRRGVIRLQSEEDSDGNAKRPSIYSDVIAIPQNVIMIKLVLSYYANSMERHDGLCIDYSIDSTTWHSKKCWHALEDFENGIWYDNIDVKFHLKEDHSIKDDHVVLDGFRIRLRCKADSLHDDMLIDKVQLLGQIDEK